MTVRLVVAGRIATKGSRTAGVRRDGSTYTRPASRHEHPWVETVARHAMLVAPGGPLDPPYRVALAFFYARPGRPAHAWPSRLDVDKAARAVLDGLVRGRLLVDDRHIVDLRASSTWAAGLDGERVQVLVEHGVHA